MALMRGLSKGDVLIDEGEAHTGDLVGAGANFVERMGGDWAENFLGTASQRRTALTPSIPLDSASQSQHTAFSTYPAVPPGVQYLAQPVVDNEAQSWDRQFQDQEAILMSQTSTRPVATRRKSVHFDSTADETLARSSVPDDLREAFASPMSIPGARSAWEESMDNDFGEEAFAQFNGPARVAQDGRIGVGQLEGWGDLQQDWEEFSKMFQSVAPRGMGTGDQAERYLFQSRNPYTQDVEGMDGGRESLTLKVCSAITVPSHRTHSPPVYSVY